MTTLLVPDRMAIPPPTSYDNGRHRISWVRGHTIGVVGFDHALDAANAAWIANRTLSRKLAPLTGTRPIPVGTEPLALVSIDVREMIVTPAGPFAELLRPEPGVAGGRETFGFEVAVPKWVSAADVHILADFAYRTIRKSGVPWTSIRGERKWRSARIRRAPAAETRLARSSPRGPWRLAFGGALTLVLAAIALVASVALLGVALILPGQFTLALATTILLALVAFRTAALFGNWLPHRRSPPGARWPSREPLDWRPARITGEDQARSVRGSTR